MFLDSNTDRGVLTLHVRGRWLIENLAPIEAELARVDVAGARAVAIDASRLEDLDLSGGWALHRRVELLRERGIAVEWKPDPPAHVRFIEGAIARAREQAARPQADFDRWLPENPNVRLARSDHRGYLRLAVDAERLHADLVAVDDVARADSGTRVLATFDVVAGRAGVAR